MKVNIETKEFSYKQGLFKKIPAYEVIATVIFSEEEKQIIRSRNIGDRIVMERDKPFTVNADIDYDLPLKDLLKGACGYVVSTPSEAREYKEALTEQLKLLKDFIDDNADLGEESTSFEL